MVEMLRQSKRIIIVGMESVRIGKADHYYQLHLEHDSDFKIQGSFNDVLAQIRYVLHTHSFVT